MPEVCGRHGTFTSHDAVRLLCNAIRAVHHVVVEQEGLTPACRDTGEYVLQDALVYLAHGNVSAARELIERYEEWQQTGKAGWPYDGESEGPSSD